MEGEIKIAKLNYLQAKPKDLSGLTFRSFNNPQTTQERQLLEKVKKENSELNADDYFIVYKQHSKQKDLIFPFLLEKSSIPSEEDWDASKVLELLVKRIYYDENNSKIENPVKIYRKELIQFDTTDKENGVFLIPDNSIYYKSVPNIIWKSPDGKYYNWNRNDTNIFDIKNLVEISPDKMNNHIEVDSVNEYERRLNGPEDYQGYCNIL